MDQTSTEAIQWWLDRLRQGDEAARDELLRWAYGRLERLTRTMLKSYPRVKRWEDTADVLQQASLRLWRALQQVQPPTVPEFFRLATLHIRHELLDLVRHYCGPHGLDTHYQSDFPPADQDDPSHVEQDPADPASSLVDLADWTVFHQQVETLPADERAVVDLLWYSGLSQEEAARVLQVSRWTVGRHWRSALVRLHAVVKGQE
jgi:RNA polymerase sigma factor (sigma-70 family)